MWTLVIFGALAAFVAVLLLIDGRRREHAVARDWELVLTPRGQRLLDRVERQVKDELTLADMVHERADEAHARGDLAEAYRLVDVGCQLIEAYAPRMVNALGAWLVLSRMAAAIAPVRPLRPRDFRLAQLSYLAQLGRFFHHLLVSTGERFRLRVHILQRGFRTVASLALRWRQQPARPPAWEDVGAVHHDVGALSAESLLTFRTLLVSLDAERRST